MGSLGGELRVDVLGRLRIRPTDAGAGADREVTTVSAPQQQALLAMLAMKAGRPVTLAELIDGLTDHPPAQVVSMISTYIGRLRGALEPGRARRAPSTVLATVPGGYVLNVPPERVDAHAFTGLVAAAHQARAAGQAPRARELLGEALSLWRGTALAGMPGPGPDTHRASLHEQRLAALEARAEVDLELGAHAGVVAELRDLAAEHPFRERLQATLMLALYRSGRQADALEVFRGTREVLAEELGIEPGPALQLLHGQILAADPVLDAPAPAPLAVRGTRSDVPFGLRGVPAQLPATPADFTGRTKEVRALTDALAPVPGGELMPVVAICGLGGEGKTTLAVRAAHGVASRYPGGQLYVDLRGTGDDPADPSDVLAGFLAAFGVAAQTIPDELQARADLFRSMSTDRRVLVVLDNAADAAQVRPLLPGDPGCAVIVTSRPVIAGLPVSVRIALDGLPPGQALQLVRAIAGAARVDAEPGSAAALAAVCAYHPLSLRIAASRLAERPAWTIAHLVDSLADSRRIGGLKAGDLAVEATFDVSYRQLPARAARALRFAAIPHLSAVTPAVMGVLLGCDRAAAEEQMELLVDTALATSPAPGTYALHDLVAEFARARGRTTDTADQRSQAFGALLSHYGGAVTAAQRLCLPAQTSTPSAFSPGEADGGFEDQTQARKWTVEAAPGILAVTAQTARDPALARHLGAAASVLHVLVDFVRWSPSLPLLEPAAAQIAEAAETAGDVRAQATALIAITIARTGMVGAAAAAGAVQAAEQAVELARKALAAAGKGDPAGEHLLMHALYARAMIMFYSGDLAGALARLGEMGELARRLGDQEMIVEFGQAEVFLRHLLRSPSPEGPGDPLAVLREGFDYHRRHGNTTAQNFALYRLGVVLADLGRFEESSTTLVTLIDNGTAEGRPGRAVHALPRMIENAIAMGEPRAAEAFARDAMEAASAHGHPMGLARAQAMLGRVLAGQGRTGEAAAELAAAAGRLEALGLPDAPLVRALAEQQLAARQAIDRT